MLKHTLRTLRRCVGMAWHLGGHALPVLLHAIRVRRQRGEVVFIDLGAANGDTAEQAMALWPRLDRLILFEPGRTRFDRLQQRFGSDKRVELVRAAAGAETIESARLYHERPMGDGRYFQGQGDSLLAMKRNIDTSDFEEVQILAFSAFLLEKT
ncbi:MAG: hypothetical protein KJ726_09690, partial [Verrucomicrobia bacterium]|nr:hypothetical protein [Verrucomicrobiota bacterium]